MTIAGRTYRQLIDEVLAFQFAAGKYEPLVKTWLNDAQRMAVTEGELRTQEEHAAYATSVGDTTLALPEDFSRFIDLYDADTGTQLYPLDLRDFDRLTAASGRPTAYSVIDDEANIWPSPDGAYSLALRYWKLPPDMVADSDEPSLPKQHHHRLIAYAMWKAYARENDRTERELWKADWEAGILKMRGEAQHDVFDGPRQVQGSYGSPQPSMQIPR